MTTRDLLTRLFSSAPGLGIRGTFQFVFSPDAALSVQVRDAVSVTPGVAADADLVVRMAEEAFSAVVSGTANVEQMFSDGRLRFEGNVGLATRLPELVAHARGEKPSAIQGEGRWPARARPSEVISAGQPSLSRVSRIPHDELSAEHFRERYVETGTPVLLSGALGTWPLHRMSPAEAAAHFDEVSGITRHGDYAANAFSQNREFRTTRVGDFLRSIQHATTRPDAALPAYLANNAVPRELQALIEFPSVFPRDAFHPPRFWLGPAGTVTPLHRDGSDNLFAQVWGGKVLLLAPPHARPNLYAWCRTATGEGLEGCDVDPVAPDLKKHPLAAAVTFARVDVGPGDLLFIPEGWFHHVRSTTLSLSVNFWLRSKRESVSEPRSMAGPSGEPGGDGNEAPRRPLASSPARSQSPTT